MEVSAPSIAGLLIRRTLRGFVALTLVLAMIWSLNSLYSYVAKFTGERFSSGVWFNSPLEERYRLVDDLIGRKLLVGLTSSEVINVLGPPMFQAEPRKEIYYLIRGSHGFNFHEVLVVRFDGYVSENPRVVEIRRATD